MRIFGSILSVVALMATALFCSCSSDEPWINTHNPLLPDNDYNSRSFVDLVRPASDITLTRSEIESYMKDGLTGDAWEKFDFTEYYGGGVPGPDLIVVKDGKMYTPITRWSSAYGPTRFSTGLAFLIRAGVVGRGCEILISRDYDLGENHITVSGTDLSIKNIKDGKMWLSTITEYLGGRTGEGGQQLYVMTYDMGDCYKDECCRFDSIEEAYAWLIEAFREHYGEEVNINDYTGGMVILDRPMFNVGMLEAELQYYRDGHIIL